MVLLKSLSKTLLTVAEYVRKRRLSMELTQAGLAERSGIPLATLRKFEKKGIISLESLLKLLTVVGGVDELLSALKPAKPEFTSIVEVLETKEVNRKRGRKR